MICFPLNYNYRIKCRMLKFVILVLLAVGYVIPQPF